MVYSKLFLVVFYLIIFSPLRENRHYLLLIFMQMILLLYLFWMEGLFAYFQRMKMILPCQQRTYLPNWIETTLASFVKVKREMHLHRWEQKWAFLLHQVCTSGHIIFIYVNVRVGSALKNWHLLKYSGCIVKFQICDFVL